MGAEVREVDPARLAGKGIKFADRFAQFALLAAEEAVRESGIEWTGKLTRRTAVITGSCLGGQTTEDRVFDAVYSHHGKRIHPLAVPRVMANAGTTHICMHFGITGPAWTVSTACSSATHAIGHAFWMVRHGLADMAIAGGSDAPFSLGHLKAWEAMRALAPDTCRPFSKHRRGIVLGEAGAMLVLEPVESARARGAKILAEVCGFAMNSDAHDLVESSVEGAVDVMRAALEDAGLHPEAIGYINAHGTGTLANDRMETKAIRGAFGKHANELVVSATKSMHGHALGAAGALAVATVLALRDSIVPPTSNFLEPDPECDLDVTPNQARRVRVEYAISNSFALGGLNAVLAFGKAV
jgi:nodulation protein E